MAELHLANYKNHGHCHEGKSVYKANRFFLKFNLFQKIIIEYIEDRKITMIANF
jgi:hypothetical protein